MKRPLPPVAVLPPEFSARLAQFLAARGTGNVVLHIKHGEIQGMKVEEHVQRTPQSRPYRVSG